MVECKGCGRELEEESNFCSHCGLRTDKGMKDGFKTPVNGRASWEKDVQAALETAVKSLEEGFRTAMESLREVADELSTELSKHRESIGRRRQDKMESLYCPKCGSENEPDAQFCINCGERIKK
jgi:predicted amidophosphoribosyltransferase